MKTWFLLAGMVGLGLVALVGGPQWFSGDGAPNPLEAQGEPTEQAALDDIVPESPTALGPTKSAWNCIFP